MQLNLYRMIRSPGRIEGFTLLEMMVSISILALVLVSIFKIQSASIRLSVSGKFYSTAANLARQKVSDIELLLRDPLRSASEFSGDFGDGFEGYSWHCRVTSLNENGSEIPDEIIKKEDQINFKKIETEIRYRDDLSYRVTSWRFIQR